MVNRQFHASAPNRLWVSDFTYIGTWTRFVYVAFVIDAYARRIVGWRASQTAHAGFRLDAPEQVLHDQRAPSRRPVQFTPAPAEPLHERQNISHDIRGGSAETVITKEKAETQTQSRITA